MWKYCIFKYCNITGSLAAELPAVVSNRQHYNAVLNFWEDAALSEIFLPEPPLAHRFFILAGRVLMK
jgi:hypothetical protein